MKKLFIMLFCLLASVPASAGCKYPGSPICGDSPDSFRVGISFLHASNSETAGNESYEHNGSALNLYGTLGADDRFFFSGIVSKGFSTQERPGEWLGSVNAGFYFWGF